MEPFFISYQRKSKAFAVELCDRLGAAGINCWMDTKIKPSEPWKPAIDTAIKESVGVILIVTLDALKSQYVTYEWSFALGLGKKIIPIVLEEPDPTNKKHPQIHPKLADIQHKKYAVTDNQFWDELKNELNLLIGKEYIAPEIRDAEMDLLGHDLSKRKSATNYLLGVTDSIAIEIFAKTILVAQTPDVAVNAGLALAQKSNYADDRAILGLEKGIKENHPQLGDVLTTLVTMNSDAAIKCIQINFDLATSTNLRRKIADSAAQFTNQKIIPVLQHMIKDMEGLQTSLVIALCNFAEPDTLPELLSIASRTDIGSKPPVMALQAIGKIGFPETIEAIFAIVNSLSQLRYQHEFEIFNAALDALKSIGGQHAVDIVNKIRSDRRFSDQYSLLNRTLQEMQSRSK